eukprot:CAMPEP_0115183804 /NCGR_PEP_ID=MMETSP0270-20121206/8639_1 /TAXON_ID=71861 /ORGANISM="Scrippsiella trochoidea, Strain CCMP3099" /LENGTH=164 /DNA_ID=CAMNT_0002596877 /DNA_START=451 /DNA_END=941 /DNA_ORIENTATION=+
MAVDSTSLLVVSLVVGRLASCHPRLKSVLVFLVFPKLLWPPASVPPWDRRGHSSAEFEMVTVRPEALVALVALVATGATRGGGFILFTARTVFATALALALAAFIPGGPADAWPPTPRPRPAEFRLPLRPAWPLDPGGFDPTVDMDACSSRQSKSASSRRIRSS